MWKKVSLQLFCAFSYFLVLFKIGAQPFVCNISEAKPHILERNCPTLASWKTSHDDETRRWSLFWLDVGKEGQ